jgi:hypothetical protein
MARSHLEIDADYSASSPAAHEKMDGPSIQEPKPPLKHNIGHAAVICITLRKNGSVEIGAPPHQTEDRTPPPPSRRPLWRLAIAI